MCDLLYRLGRVEVLCCTLSCTACYVCGALHEHVNKYKRIGAPGRRGARHSTLSSPRDSAAERGLGFFVVLSMYMLAVNSGASRHVYGKAKGADRVRRPCVRDGNRHARGNSLSHLSRQSLLTRVRDGQ